MCVCVHVSLVARVHISSVFFFRFCRTRCVQCALRFRHFFVDFFLISSANCFFIHCLSSIPSIVYTGSLSCFCHVVFSRVFFIQKLYCGKNWILLSFNVWTIKRFGYSISWTGLSPLIHSSLISIVCSPLNESSGAILKHVG